MQFARLSLIAAAVATLAACGQKAETKPAAEAGAPAEEVVKIASGTVVIRSGRSNPI